MKTIITYGTFDIFHAGHVKLLARLRALGDKLIVGLSTDEFNQLKKKTALMSYEDRKTVLESTRFVDEVVPEESWEQKSHDINKYNVDVFGIGSDWRGQFDFLEKYCEVIYLERTEGISSSSIKRLTSDLSREHVRAMQDAVDTMTQILESFNR